MYIHTYIQGWIKETSNSQFLREIAIHFGKVIRNCES